MDVNLYTPEKDGKGSHHTTIATHGTRKENVSIGIAIIIRVLTT